METWGLTAPFVPIFEMVEEHVNIYFKIKHV